MRKCTSPASSCRLWQSCAPSSTHAEPDCAHPRWEYGGRAKADGKVRDRSDADARAGMSRSSPGATPQCDAPLWCRSGGAGARPEPRLALRRRLRGQGRCEPYSRWRLGQLLVQRQGCHSRIRGAATQAARRYAWIRPPEHPRVRRQPRHGIARNRPDQSAARRNVIAKRPGASSAMASARERR